MFNNNIGRKTSLKTFFSENNPYSSVLNNESFAGFQGEGFRGERESLPRMERLEEISGSFEYEVYSAILDGYGNPRLSEARNFFLPLTRDEIPLLCECFKYWRDFHEYLLLRGRNRETGEELRLAVKCSKRGNDVYAKRLEERLGFLSRLENVKFFDNVNWDKQAYAKANLFWVTLTWNPKLCSLNEAWETSYEELHKFKANLEHCYGKIEWLVFIQPFPDGNGEAFGYPHFHIVMLFKEAEFNVFPHLEQDKDGATVLRYRVKEKREIELAGKWHSFIDVQALSSLRGAVNYVKKYAESVCYGDSDKAVLTNAITWLYRKKSYSMTREFQKALNDLISGLHVRKNLMQATLDGNALPVWAWEFCGVVSGAELGVGDGGVWVLELSVDDFERVVRS